MAKIKYVGLKAQKADNVAGTGMVWLGAGDVRDVPDSAVARLLKHPDVWALVGSAEGLQAATPVDPGAGSAAKFVLEGPDGAIVLDAMDDAALRAWADQNLKPAGVTIHHNKRGDKLRQAIIDAVKTAGAEA